MVITSWSLNLLTLHLDRLSPLNGKPVLVHILLPVTDKCPTHLVAQLTVHPAGDQEIGVQPPPGQQHSFVETDHEIFSTVILSLLLIHEGQKGQRSLPLRGLSLPSKVW